jgi:hypothetical protein
MPNVGCTHTRVNVASFQDNEIIHKTSPSADLAPLLSIHALRQSQYQ